MWDEKSSCLLSKPLTGGGKLFNSLGCVDEVSALRFWQAFLKGWPSFGLKKESSVLEIDW